MRIDDPGNNDPARNVDPFRALWNGNAVRGADRSDLAVLNHKHAVFNLTAFAI